jgi:hypothetical protein
VNDANHEPQGSGRALTTTMTTTTARWPSDNQQTTPARKEASSRPFTFTRARTRRAETQYSCATLVANITLSGEATRDPRRQSRFHAVDLLPVEPRGTPG